MVEWSCTKEIINERGPYNLVEWPCANKKKKINEDPSFRSNGRALKKEMKEDTIIKSNGRVQIKKINQ